MPRFINIHRALRGAAILPVAISLAAANCGLAAANPPDPPSGGETTRLAAVDTPLIEKAGKSKPSPTDIKPVGQEPTTAEAKPPPAQTESSSSKKAWIYGGLGVAAAAAIVAVAAGGGGGGSSAPATTPPNNGNNSGTGTDSGGCHEDTPVNQNPRSPVANNPNTTPVCADLSGQWSGTLSLADNGSTYLTAIVAQDGDQIQITTSSSKAYGKLFIGTVGADCNFSLWDQTTGEEWSSRLGPATANRIAIYDYVQTSCYGNTKYDSLILTR